MDSERLSISLIETQGKLGVRVNALRCLPPLGACLGCAVVWGQGVLGCFLEKEEHCDTTWLKVFIILPASHAPPQSSMGTNFSGYVVQNPKLA